MLPANLIRLATVAILLAILVALSVPSSAAPSGGAGKARGDLSASTRLASAIIDRSNLRLVKARRHEHHHAESDMSDHGNDASSADGREQSEHHTQNDTVSIQPQNLLLALVVLLAVMIFILTVWFSIPMFKRLGETLGILKTSSGPHDGPGGLQHEKQPSAAVNIGNHHCPPTQLHSTYHNASALPMKAAGRCFDTSREYVAHSEFNATKPGEMDLSIGDYVCIDAVLEGGWALGRNLHKNTKGLFPILTVADKTAISRLKASNQQDDVYRRSQPLPIGRMGRTLSKNLGRAGRRSRFGPPVEETGIIDMPRRWATFDHETSRSRRKDLHDIRWASMTQANYMADASQHGQGEFNVHPAVSETLTAGSSSSSSNSSSNGEADSKLN
ncbi:hypothetical protein EV182_003852, partial [Spiromyces aspiralis]